MATASEGAYVAEGAATQWRQECGGGSLQLEAGRPSAAVKHSAERRWSGHTAAAAAAHAVVEAAVADVRLLLWLSSLLLLT